MSGTCQLSYVPLWVILSLQRYLLHLSPGTIIYVSFLKKYFIMEDDCSDCDSAWNNNHSYEISLWTGGDANSSQSAQQSCENSLTPSSSQAVEVKPASNLTIDTTPLFTDSGGCIKL